MSNFEDIFKRLDIQSIREYLMSGTDLVKKDNRSYEDRVLTQEDNILKVLRSNFPDNTEYDDVTDMVLAYGNTSKEVYMEIGIQCGFILAKQLLFNSIDVADQ